MKYCNKCKTDKEENEFSPSQLKLKSGICKKCAVIKSKKWAEEHPDQIKTYQREYYQENKEKLCATSVEHYQKNKEKKIKYQREYYQENKEEILEEQKQYNQEHKEKRNENNKKYRKDRLKNDPIFRLHCLVSTMVWTMLQSQGSSKDGESSFKYLPWTSEKLWHHIVSLFEPWMHQDNQGKYDPETWDDNDPKTWTWQLDHIIPQSDLPYPTMEHENFLKCWSLSNLRPLSAKQNVLDGVKRTRHKKRDK